MCDLGEDVRVGMTALRRQRCDGEGGRDRGRKFRQCLEPALTSTISPSYFTFPKKKAWLTSPSLPPFLPPSLLPFIEPPPDPANLAGASLRINSMVYHRP